MLAKKNVDMYESLYKKVEFIGRNMSLEVKNKGLSFFLLERPQETLKDTTKKEIFDVFYPVALSAFNRDDTDYFREDVYSHLFSGYFLTLVFDRSKRNLGVAFMSSNFIKYNDLKIFYVEGTAVASEYHNLGIYRSIIKEMSQSADLVACRTQNPAAFIGLSRIFTTIYPVNKNPDQEIKEIASNIARYLDMKDYDYHQMKGYGTYGQSLTGSVLTPSNSEEINFLKNIDCAAGDCLILICPV